MTYALSGTTITQTGTDIDLSGLSGVAGVIIIDKTTHLEYDLRTNGLRLVITGTQTIAGTVAEAIRFKASPQDVNDLDINGGTLTIGEYKANPLDYDYMQYIPVINQPWVSSFNEQNGYAGEGQVGKRCSFYIRNGGQVYSYGRVVNVGCIGTETNARIEVYNSIWNNHSGNSYIYTPNLIINDSVFGAFTFASNSSYISLNNWKLPSSSAHSLFVLPALLPQGLAYTIKNISDLNGKNLIALGRTSGNNNIAKAYNLETGSDQTYSVAPSRKWAGELYRDIQFKTTNVEGNNVTGAYVYYVGSTGTETTATTDASGEYDFSFKFATIEALDGVVQAPVLFTKNGDTTEDLIDVKAIAYGQAIIEKLNVSLRGLEVLKVDFNLLPDFSITEQNKAITEAYTGIDTSTKFYDFAKSYLVDNYAGEAETIVTRTGDEIDAGSYNITVDATATSVLSFDGTTITIKATTFTGSLRTTGVVSAVNGANIVGGIRDANGDSFLSFTNEWEVYATEDDRNISANILGSGTSLEIFRFNYVPSTTYYMWVAGTKQQVTPTSTGETPIDLSTAALLVQTNKSLANIEVNLYVDTRLSVNGDGSPQSPFNNIDDAVVAFRNAEYSFVSLKSDPNHPALPTASVANVKIKGDNALACMNLNGQSYEGAELDDMLLSGSQDATDTVTVYIHCKFIGDSSNICGNLERCQFTTLDGSNMTMSLNGKTAITDSHITSAGDVIFDLTAATGTAVRGLSGILNVTNITTGMLSIESMSGEVVIEPSATGGIIRCNDSVVITDNSNGATVDLDGSTLQAISMVDNTPDPSAIADAVWDEAYADHTTAGTFGKLMDILRKSNLATDGVVSGTPTATEFTSNLTEIDGAHDHKILLFTAGSLSGESRPILTYSATDGRIVMQEPFTAAPNAGDEFVITVSHVHPVSEIQEGLALETTSQAILTDTDELQQNQGDWATATGFATALDVSSARDAVQQDISALNDFDPEVDIVSRVTLVDTVTENTDMRGTDNANTIAPDNTSIASILTDTDELQQNQNNWVTADISALETKVQADVRQGLLIAEHDATQTAISNIQNYDDTALIGKVDVIDGNVDAIKAKTDALVNYDDTAINTKLDAIPTTDSVADITPVLTAIGSLNNFDPATETVIASVDLTGIATATDVSTAETNIIAAMPTPDEMTAAELHTALDSYANKDSFKADVSNLSADVNVVEVAGVAVSSVDDFKADVSNLSADVNVVQVAGSPVAGVDDFKADVTNSELTLADKNELVTLIQQGILDENDGQAILNAIVGAIGNTNVDQVALVAAIRVDLERNDGLLNNIPENVRTELSTELARIDTDLSSRLADTDYIAPDNDSIADAKDHALAANVQTKKAT